MITSFPLGIALTIPISCPSNVGTNSSGEGTRVELPPQSTPPAPPAWGGTVGRGVPPPPGAHMMYPPPAQQQVVYSNQPTQVLQQCAPQAGLSITIAQVRLCTGYFTATPPP